LFIRIQFNLIDFQPGLQVLAEVSAEVVGDVGELLADFVAGIQQTCAASQKFQAAGPAVERDAGVERSRLTGLECRHVKSRC
jgi:hypothetical protein